MEYDNIPLIGPFERIYTDKALFHRRELGANPFAGMGEVCLGSALAGNIGRSFQVSFQRVGLGLDDFLTTFDDF
jgi:hypothetical protein